MSLSRKSGRVKFIENGLKIVPDKFSEEMIEWMKNIPETVKKNQIHRIILKNHTYTRQLYSHLGVSIEIRWSNICQCMVQLQMHKYSVENLQMKK